MFNVLDVARFALGTVAKAAAKVPVIDARFRIGDRLHGPWPEGPAIWMHGASLGECKMLLNLAKFMQEDIPDCPRILITTQKVEVLRFLNESGADISCAMAPADTQSALNLFVKSVKPLALILAENELWPGYLSSMRRLSIKPSVAVVSGRYHRSFPGIDFSAIGFASMQTGGNLTRFRNAASNTNALIGGDWKLLPWARSGSDVKPNENPTVDTVFVSMHMSEWASLSQMIESSIKRQESVVLIPRRLDEVAAFRKALLEREILVVDWPLVQKGTVSLISRFGLTHDVFATAKSAIVGGSFSRELGVHDFWEPLQMGVATCVGPFSSGQSENISALVREGVITQIHSTANFAKRANPDPKLVSAFLTHERARILDAYNQFIQFVQSLIPKGSPV